MKCKLRKVAEGIVTTIETKTIDNNLKAGDAVWVDNKYLATIKSVAPRRLFVEIEYTNDNGELGSHSLMSGRCELIIASTFKVGKELCIKEDEIVCSFSSNLLSRYTIEHLEQDCKEYEYTETETEVIINL